MLAFNNTILLVHLAQGIDKIVYEDYTQALICEIDIRLPKMRMIKGTGNR